MARINPKDRRAINKRLHDLTKGYHAEIPLSAIFDVLKRHNIVPLQEDKTPWSGLLCGDNGETCFDLGEKEFEDFGIKPAWDVQGESEVIFYDITNSVLRLSWYKMQSGRYEVLAYLT